MSGSVKTMEVLAQLSSYQFINNMWYKVNKLMKIVISISEQKFAPDIGKTLENACLK
jgi:hypothetical protein